MEIAEATREAIKSWLAAGASLSEVQKRLKEEFDIRMTYMDLRLLVLDIGAEVKDKPEPKPKEPEQPPREEVPEEEQDVDGVPPMDEEGGVPANVSITVDQIVIPGAMVSGTVTFSDGTDAKWLIDQMGRIRLEPSVPGYRPSDSDMQAFPLQLQSELVKKGYA